MSAHAPAAPRLRNPRRMPFTSIPHSTHLFTDFLYHFPKVQEFYRIPRVECRLDSHHNRIKSVRRPVLTIHVLKKRDNCLSRAGSAERDCLSKHFCHPMKAILRARGARTLWKSQSGAAQSSTARVKLWSRANPADFSVSSTLASSSDRRTTAIDSGRDAAGLYPEVQKRRCRHGG